MKTHIIGLCGKMGSGKSTVCDMITAELHEYGYEVIVKKFAQPLYDMQEFIYKRAYLDQPATKDRKLLQWLGTEWGRSLDHDLWVDIWEQDVRHDKFFTGNDKVIYIADDIRFDNEAEKVTEMGGIVIRVDAPEDIRAARIKIQNTKHSSEKGISDKYVYATIYNNTNSIESLCQNVQYLMTTLNMVDESEDAFEG